MTSLGHKARSAVVWNTGFNLFRDFLQFCSMIVLVRILAKSAYGEFSLVNSIIGFLSTFSFNNFVAYTLQVRDEADVHYQDHFTAGAAIQGALFVLANLVALCLWWLPTYAPVAPMVHVMSLGFLISFPADFRIRMLEREFDWKRLRLLHAIGLLVMTGVAIALALLGAGAYALLCPGLLVAVPFIFDLVARMKWRPDWTWSWRRYKPAWHFGLSRSASGLAGTGRQLLESGVMAKMLGFATLGVANRALGLSQMLCTKYATQLLYALYPMLTRYEPGSPEFARVASLVLRTVAWAVIPLAVVLSILAAPVVGTLYGAKLAGVVPLLPWYMGVAVTTALAYVGYMLLLAGQRPNWCLALDCAGLAGTALSAFTLLRSGLIPYLAGITFMQVALCLVTGSLLLRVKSVTWAGLSVTIVPAAVAAAAAVGLCEALVYLSRLEKAVFAVAFVYGVTFCAMYVAVLRLFFENHMAELVAYIPGGQRMKILLRLD